MRLTELVTCPLNEDLLIVGLIPLKEYQVTGIQWQGSLQLLRLVNEEGEPVWVLAGDCRLLHLKTIEESNAETVDER